MLVNAHSCACMYLISMLDKGVLLVVVNISTPILAISLQGKVNNLHGSSEVRIPLHVTVVAVPVQMRRSELFPTDPKHICLKHEILRVKKQKMYYEG